MHTFHKNSLTLQTTTGGGISRKNSLFNDGNGDVKRENFFAILWQPVKKIFYAILFKKLLEKFAQSQLEVWLISNSNHLCPKIYFGAPC